MICENGWQELDVPVGMKEPELHEPYVRDSAGERKRGPAKINIKWLRARVSKRNDMHVDVVAEIWISYLSIAVNERLACSIKGPGIYDAL